MLAAEVFSPVTSGATVVEIVISGRKFVVVLLAGVVVIIGADAVVTSGGVSGNLEVDVPVSQRTVILQCDEYEIALKLLIP
jgi:hypothetical protein